MSINFFLRPLTLCYDLYRSDLFAWISKNKTLFHAADSCESFGIWASFYRLEHSKVSKVEDKDFGLQDYNTAIRLNPDSLDFAFTAGFYNAF